MFVPRELGPIARLIAGTPPGIADRVKKLLNADTVMAHADTAARAAYTATNGALRSREIAA